MAIKEFFKKIKGMASSTEPKISPKKRKKRKNKTEYENRFQRFYHVNKKRLNGERRLTYKQKMQKGICVRCKERVVKGIVFCKFHQEKQKEYNLKARSKKVKKSKK